MNFEEILKLSNVERFQQLTLEQLHMIWDIRNRAAWGEDLTRIGEAYDLTKSYVSLIASGKRYGDVLTPTGKKYSSKQYKDIVAKRQGWKKHYDLEVQVVNQDGLLVRNSLHRNVAKDDLQPEINQIVNNLHFLHHAKLDSSVFRHTFSREFQGQGVCTLTILITER